MKPAWCSSEGVLFHLSNTD